MPRLLGTRGDSSSGPTLLLVGGIHGNEPAGVGAIEDVLAAIDREHVAVGGRVVGMLGNAPALASGVRYVDRDLNRGWTAEQLASLAAGDRPSSVEDREQHELQRAIERTLSESASLVIVDLHSTSGPAAPFACVGVDAPARHVAGSVPVPVLIGLERMLPGTMLSWAESLGLTGLSIEGGQHDAPSTRAHLVAGCWLALVDLGLVARDDAPDLPRQFELLRAAAHGLPRAVQIDHRHVVGEDDDFEMLPGFATFDRVEQGEPLARDRRGPILAPRSGRIVMPRYQGLGEDGFFLGHDVAPAWQRAEAPHP